MPYIGKSPSFGVRNRFVYVASSGATSVSGADANGATLTFTDGAFVDVYLNGVLLKPTTDYNTSTANTIAGLSALNTSDEVTVVVYDVFAVADTVSATSGGTFSGNVNFGGDIDVDGTTNLDVVDIDGALTQDGGAVFNEASADVDFRVESNGNTHMLFVDGGNDALAIGSTVSNPYSFSGTTNPVGINATGTNQGSQLSIASTGTGVSCINFGNDSIRRGGIFAVDGSHLTFATNNGNSGTSITEAMRIDSSGHVTKPLQSAFQVKPNSDQSDIAVGSDVTVVLDTEIFDQNADFASNTFTAPVTGKYQINVHILLGNVDSAATLYQLKIITSNRTYYYTVDTDFGQDNAFFPLQNNVLADMDASDTCVIKVNQSGGSSQTDILSTTSVVSGYLVC